MDFDIFFSISQTPDTSGYKPSENEMFRNFFDQVELADELGFGVGWVAQAHLSTEVQKQNKNPVVPYYPGEVGLCTDFFQVAREMFARTKKIEVGSAVMSILASGGPIAQAERVGAFLALHGINPEEKRKLHIGFSAGRFEFMARPYGIIPRDELEEEAWPVLRGQIFSEASEIFLRLVKGEVISSEMISQTVLDSSYFRTQEEWQKVRDTAIRIRNLKNVPEVLEFENRYNFEQIRTIPKEWRRDLLNLILGSHDKRLQNKVNEILPVQVFNLSITPPEVIEETHKRLEKNYHSDGGIWKRNMMPRTVMIFVNDEEGLSSVERSQAAKEEAKSALSTYWNALDGTIDPSKLEKAADNAVIGNIDEVANQIIERFHPEDRIMCWFDFFNHDNERVKRNMSAFMNKISKIINGEK